LLRTATLLLSGISVGRPVVPFARNRYSGRMNTEDVLDEFRKVGALLEGHFILSSGRRSPVLLQ
jgi:hypothetical protein